MNTISISALKQLKVSQIKELLPCEVTSDGEVVFAIQSQLVKEVIKEVKSRTKCPNCHLEYEVTPPDGKPFYFTMRHTNK